MPARLRQLVRRFAVVAACVTALALAGAAGFGAPMAFADGMGSMQDMSGGASSDAGSGDAATQAFSKKKSKGTMHVAVGLDRLVGTSTPGKDSKMDRETMGRVFPGLLDIETDPVSINVGKECSMKDLCGIDPCTCGKPDAWGHCACAGFEEVAPTLSIESSDDGVASVEEFAGRSWIVPHGTGTAVVTVRASLVHYKTVEYRFTLTIEPFGFVDALLIAAALALVVLAVLAVWLIGGCLLRCLRRMVRRCGARRRVVAQLKHDHPARWRELLAERDDGPFGSRRLFGRGRRPRRPRATLHELRFAARDAALPCLAAALVLIVLVPVSTTVVPSISIFNIDYTHEQLKYQLFAQGLGPAVLACCVVLGVALGFALFGFVLVRQAVTAHFSVGMARARIFAVRFAAGVIACALAIGLPFAASLALNVAALGLYPGELGAFAYVVCGYALTAAVSFAISSAALLLAGSRAEAVAFAATGVLGVTVVLWAAGVLLQQLLPGCAWGVAAYNQTTPIEPSPLAFLAAFNPVLFFAQMGAEKQFFAALHPVYYPVPGNMLLLVAWGAVLVALVHLGAWLMEHRRGEQAEIAGLTPLATYAVSAVAGLAAFACALSLLAHTDALAAMAAACVCFAGIAAAVLLGPLRGKMAPRRVASIVAVESAALIAACALTWTGFFGLTERQPAETDVSSVEVSYVGAPAYMTGEYQGVTHGGAYYATTSRSYRSASSIKTVEAAERLLLSDAHEHLGDDCLPLDVTIRYVRKDGRVITRYYAKVSQGAFDKLIALQDDAHARKLEAAVITADTTGLERDDRATVEASPLFEVYKTGDVALAGADLSDAHELSLSGSDRAELMSALAEDVRAMSASDRYDATAPIRATLLVSTSLEQDMGTCGYSFNSSVTYLTDAYSNALAWLRDHGYVADDAGSGIDADSVGAAWTSVTLERDTATLTTPLSRYFMGYRADGADEFWYDGVTAAGGTSSRVETDDSELMARIAHASRAGCLMDGGYLVRATRADGGYTYLYLPAANMTASLERNIDGLSK